MIVDTSAVVEALISTAPDDDLVTVMDRLDLHAPFLLELEVANTLRQLVLAKKLDAQSAEEAREMLASMPINLQPVSGLMDRVWELRHNFNAYDAAYIALAEALELPLVTCDAKLRANGAGKPHTAEVLLFPRS